MNMLANHIIGSLRWETHCQEQARVHELQNYLSHFSRFYLGALCDEIFSHYCHEPYIWQSEQITLDLGALTWDTLGAELPKRISRALTEYFQNACASQVLIKPNDAAVENNVQHAQEIKHQSTAAALVPVDNAKRQSTLVHFFLSTGLLPWWADRACDPVQLLEQLINKKHESFLAELRGMGQVAQVRHRLVRQLGNKKLPALVRALEPAYAGFICGFVQNMQTLQAKTPFTPVSNAEFDQPLWYVVLTQVFVDRGSLFNTKAFLHAALLHLAVQLDMDFSCLLAQLACAARQLEGIGHAPPRFISAIIALESEQPVAKASPQTISLNQAWQSLHRALKQEPSVPADQNNSQGSAQVNLDRAFWQLARDERQRLVVFLHGLKQVEWAPARMAATFSAPTLRLVVQLLRPQDAPFILEHVRHTQHIEPFKPQLARAVWRIVLGYLLNNAGSYFDRSQFVRQTLFQTAAAHNLNAHQLLRALLDNLNPQKTHQHTIELLRILMALQAREARATLQRQVTVEPSQLSYPPKHGQAAGPANSANRLTQAFKPGLKHLSTHIAAPDLAALIRERITLGEAPSEIAQRLLAQVSPTQGYELWRALARHNSGQFAQIYQLFCQALSTHACLVLLVPDYKNRLLLNLVTAIITQQAAARVLTPDKFIALCQTFSAQLICPPLPGVAEHLNSRAWPFKVARLARNTAPHSVNTCDIVSIKPKRTKPMSNALDVLMQQYALDTGKILEPVNGGANGIYLPDGVKPADFIRWLQRRADKIILIQLILAAPRASREGFLHYLLPQAVYGLAAIKALTRAIMQLGCGGLPARAQFQALVQLYWGLVLASGQYTPVDILANLLQRCILMYSPPGRHALYEYQLGARLKNQAGWSAVLSWAPQIKSVPVQLPAAHGLQGSLAYIPAPVQSRANLGVNPNNPWVISAELHKNHPIAPGDDASTLYTSCTEAMHTHYFRPSKRGTFLTSQQGCIHGVSEIMCIHCWCLGSNKRLGQNPSFFGLGQNLLHRECQSKNRPINRHYLKCLARPTLSMHAAPGYLLAQPAVAGLVRSYLYTGQLPSYIHYEGDVDMGYLLALFARYRPKPLRTLLNGITQQPAAFARTLAHVTLNDLIVAQKSGGDGGVLNQQERHLNSSQKCSYGYSPLKPFLPVPLHPLMHFKPVPVNRLRENQAISLVLEFSAALRWVKLPRINFADLNALLFECVLQHSGQPVSLLANTASLLRTFIWQLLRRYGLKITVIEQALSAVTQARSARLRSELHMALAHFARPAQQPNPLPPPIMPAAVYSGGLIEITNAGLVLIQGFLPILFARLGYLDDGKFIDKTTQVRAVLITQYLVTGQTTTPECYLPLNKILCGLAIEEPVNRHLEISLQEQETCLSLLNSVLQRWPEGGSSSIDGLRGNWFVRQGTLKERPDHWDLIVEKKPYDLLLDRSPFAFSIVKFSWLTTPIYVTWPTG